MVSQYTIDEAVELLQELGLKEYEAKCFVGLSRMSRGTAKELSEITDVPRTRVYDAIRVLEAEGLVEIQHSSPQRFRAVPLDEAASTIETKFDSRIDELRIGLNELEPVDSVEDPISQEVWALSGSDAIETRTNQLIADATTEVVLIVGYPAVLSEDLFETLNAFPEDLVVIIGAVNEGVQTRLVDELPHAEIFVSGLEWLDNDDGTEGDTAIGRFLLVDQETLLVSSYEPESGVERAIFGGGLENGLIVIIRRLMKTGLLPRLDPQTD